MKIPFFVKDLPSGGIIPPQNIKHYNRDTYYIELEPLSYVKVLEFEKEKNKVKDNKLKRLAVCIDHLIADEHKDFPISDMYCLISYVSMLSSFDFVGDAEKEGDALTSSKPYYITDVDCPLCGKHFDRLYFKLSDIDYLKYPDEILSGKAIWKSVIKFNLTEKYTFSMPTIREFRRAIDEYLDAYGENYGDENYETTIRLISLALALNKYKQNLKENEITFKEKFSNLRDLYESSTAGDAMKLERIYRDLIQPVVLVGNFCDCNKGGSVFDISMIITEILRHLKLNSGRIIADIYLFDEEMGDGRSTELELQFSGRKPFPTHQEIRRQLDSREGDVRKNSFRESEEPTTEYTGGDSFYE